MGFSNRLSDLANKIVSAASAVTFGATVESTSGGFKFPDGTTQTTAASGGGGAALRVVYLGDSLGGTPLWGRTLPDHLRDTLRNGGVDVEVFSVAKDAMTFYRANTQTDFGSNTAVEQTIALDPDVVVVALGANDIVFGVDGRTPAQVADDATTLLGDLRAGLPSAHIAYMRELLYDSTHVSAGSTLNRHTIPALHSIPGSGVNADCRVFEELASATSAGTRTNLADLDSLFTGVSGNGNVDSVGTLDVFKVLFFGCSIGDGVHPDELGALFLSNYVYKHLRAEVPGFENLKTEGQAGYHDFDELFALGTTDVGTYYSHTNTHGEVYRVGRAHNVNLLHKKNTWFLSTELAVTLVKEAIENSTNDHYSFVVEGGIPGQLLYTRIWLSSGSEPATWTSTGRTFDTSGKAMGLEHGASLGLSNGTYKVKYSVIAADAVRDVAGPISVNLY